MESYRTRYIAILNKFKKGEIELTRRDAFTYLAALKLNMILWDGKRDINILKNGNIDLVNLDHTKVARINLRDNVSRIIMPTFTKIPRVHKIMLVCENNIAIDDNFIDYEIVKLDYEEELSNVPIDTFTTHYISRLKLAKQSQVLYQPKIHTFIESEIVEDIEYIDQIRGILTINKSDSMIIIADCKYYTVVMRAIEDCFCEFNFTRKGNLIKIKGHEICGWKYLLRSIVDNLK